MPNPTAFRHLTIMIGWFFRKLFKHRVSNNEYGTGKQWNDSPLENPREDDFIIAVVGSSGAGKSTFVNTLLGEEVTVVGHELDVETTRFQHFRFELFDRHIVVIDTPPLEFAYERERNVYFARLKSLLAQPYTPSTKIKISGVVLIHEITSSRSMANESQLRPFEELCGRDWTQKVVLATTKWDMISQQTGQLRERELIGHFWGQKPNVHRFLRTQESANKIVRSLVPPA